MTQNIRIGIDLGGTKIELQVLNQQGQTLFRQRVATPQGDYRGTLKAIQSLISHAESSLKPSTSIGLGVPGSLSPQTGLMRNANSTCLNHQPLKADLESMLHRNVSITNDANCFALSESTDGAGQNARSVFAVIIGTGVGAGLVINGQVWDGCNGIAGEWGHNPLPWPDSTEIPGPDCWCGQSGCLETWLSGPALSQHYEKLTGSQHQPTEIVEAARMGDDLAEKILQGYEHRLARGLAQVINLLDPDTIILGGGLSNIERLYDNIPRLWRSRIFSDTINTQLLPPLHGDSSGVRGAAWLGAQNNEQQP